MQYLYETHCHTAEVSPCGLVPAADVVQMYQAKGYNGIVITDHLQPRSFEKENLTTWEATVARFLQGYAIAKKLETASFHVFLGAELRFPENDNDYLLYGFDASFLYAHPFINRMSAEEFSPLARQNNLLFVQAHPFRPYMQIMRPVFLDGYEVYNGNPRHNSSNEIAVHWAELHNKEILLSGSDFHQPEDLARGGIYLQENPADVQMLTQLLRRGTYTLRTT